MRAARFALLALAVLVTAFATSAAAAPSAPTGLRGFELRPNEVQTHTFSRTPAFAWNPVRGASCYEFELATSRTFDGSSVFWSNVATGPGSGKFCRPVTISAPASEDQTSSKSQDSGSVAGPAVLTTKIAPIRIPATSVNLVLPWFTGKPYALYAHVRAVTTRGATAWSKPFGFNMRWESTPVPLTSKPGLVRWAPVEGATAYDVWYPDIRKVVRTHTNVADQRDFYSFHLEDSWWQLVRWRVRPVRQVVGALPNGLPAVSYGPWSPTYATTNPGWAGGKLQLRAALSDAVSTDTKAAAHQLMPAMTFSGDVGADGHEYRLFRTYAFTDRDCVNAVFRGSVVGGPAFAPRVSGPLKLPTNQEELDVALGGILPSATSETAKTYMADGTPVVSNETLTGEDVVRGGSAGRRREDDALLLDGRPGRDQRGRGRQLHVLRRRVAAGRVRVRTRGELRQGVTARDHGSRNAVRLRPLAEGSPPGAGRVPPDRVFDAARRLASRRRSDGVRGAVVALEVPVARARLGAHVRDVVGAAVERRTLVLPRAWAERGTGRYAGDDVVGADRGQGRPTDLPDQPQLALAKVER